ncbi:hypothetical protein Rs2_03310 [Raphanus sativus]|uniref:F-box protein At2g35280-like n=1 Tax=Raphanus sativus TaxID=3726 RepID=A0A6J0NVE4_RAPSA|nr:F-box protein At2g35280-like [Raphanus sativus]XP_056841666.1 F-box protein At2g35280-like [Raphanus sativus]XP_056841668.1 F-box protein At2g35280-like [Raphanus sativus]XP_056856659.1 F-box protein At2g35280-like [Raphanus sativus]XP_056862398.1 F-box protein At2g35280-like [Raphanus sativus]KAJ4867348.1 hypothetical protein Rs2_51112 [Raphanus sativus]KAJ4894585.1 hypothetical protein Rs2_21379 [Raphanus sativus]KAJ4894587.1 hypothetical protein Rs2_21381 [Raphanus sativus]KAJ4907302.
MEPNKRNPTRLDTLPDDMLRVIISKVGAASSSDYANTVLSCRSMNFGLDDPLIATTLCISPLVEQPRLADNYGKLMEQLLAADNLAAHYVKGIREYFLFDNQSLGLHHLRIASNGSHREATYLYGLLRMALGMVDEGKKIISELSEDVGVASVEKIWVKVQKSISDLPLRLKDEYVATYMKMKPDVNCHPAEVDTVCSGCFHAYLMYEFFDMVIGLNPVSATA